LGDRHEDEMRTDRVQQSQKHGITAHPQWVREQALMGVDHVDHAVGEPEQRWPVAIQEEQAEKPA
jgi:hypothetical protein